MKSAKRSYRMVARAEASEDTMRRIVEVTVALFRDHDPVDITLDAIAARAGVTLQTVLRRFGSKDGLFVAVADLLHSEVLREREPDLAGDPRAAIGVLVASYERLGELSWRMLRFEAQNPALHKILAKARTSHRDWLATTFAEAIPRRDPARSLAIDALFAATDFYAWKLFRVDLGRSRAQTEAVMVALVDAVLASLPGRS
jgi:AcrR family transcriptional regulator